MGELLIPLFFFIIGICVGSFLNVIVDRTIRKETVVAGRSYCEMCKKELAWFDLIPLFSFCATLGNCRYCHKFIGWWYPLVELVTGIVFVLPFISGVFLPSFSFSDIRFWVDYSFYLFIVFAFLVVFFSDIKFGIIPDLVLLPSIAALFLYRLYHFSTFLPYLFSALGAFLFFFFLVWITKGKGMGFGDVKLVFFLGLLVGFPQIVMALYFAFLTGAIVSLILVVGKKKKLKGGTIPFGPFLLVGSVMALFFGDYFFKMIFPYLV